MGLWTVDEQEDSDSSQGVFEFKPHAGAVPRLAFDPLDGNKMISTSYDGSVRRMDVEKGTFEQVSGLLLMEVLQSKTAIASCGAWCVPCAASPRVQATRRERRDDDVTSTSGLLIKVVRVNFLLALSRFPIVVMHV